MEPDDEFVDQTLARLVGEGFFDVDAHADGTVTYRLSPNAEQIAPEIYAAMMESMTNELFEFIKMGVVEYRFNDDLELEYKFTPEGLDMLEALGYRLYDE